MRARVLLHSVSATCLLSHIVSVGISLLLFDAITSAQSTRLNFVRVLLGSIESLAAFTLSDRKSSPKINANQFISICRRNVRWLERVWRAANGMRQSQWNSNLSYNASTAHTAMGHKRRRIRDGTWNWEITRRSATKKYLTLHKFYWYDGATVRPYRYSALFYSALEGEIS